jgi:S-(hydroxymethyl)glutathione dehydrogenase / alcohol dehydrogenase
VNARIPSTMGAGTFAEETLVPAAAVVQVDPSLPLEMAALLGCAVTTGVGAVIRTAMVRPGESVLVIGCGGVGLAAIQGARLAGAARIIAADTAAGQLSTATANGATDTIDASDVDVVAAVRDLTWNQGVDHGIEVVGKPATIRAAYDATRRGGTVTLVGAAGIEETVTFNALSLMADGKTTRQRLRRKRSRARHPGPGRAGLSRPARPRGAGDTANRYR